MIARFFSDFRLAARGLLRNRSFAAAAILALILGIGANTAIFTVLHSVVLSPLPFKRSDRLAMLWSSRIGERSKDSVVPANFLDWRRQSHSFEELAGFFPFLRMNLFTGDRAEVVRAASVTGNFFETLDVDALRGRVFKKAGDEPLVVLGYDLWQRVFKGKKSVVGSTIRLNKASYSVIGVAPPSLDFPTGVDLYVRAPGDVPQIRTDMPEKRLLRLRYMRAFGRLAPGASLGRAQAEMESITRRLEQVRPDRNAGRTTWVLSLHEDKVGDVRPALTVLMAMVSFVLLIACVNAASLVMARATSRQQEMATRIALGAGRRDLVRQLISEGLLLSLIAATVSLLVAQGLLELLVRYEAGTLPRIHEVSLDGTVLAFTFGPALLVALLFSLMPIVQLYRTDLAKFLKEGAHHMTEGVGKGRLRGALLAAEVALAVVLLIATGVMLRSFLRLQAVDVGFNPKNLLVFRINLDDDRYREQSQKDAFLEEVRAKLAGLKKVKSAALVLRVPFPGDKLGGPVFVEGRPAPPEKERRSELKQAISPGYFKTMEIPVISGRTFNAEDTASSPPVAVVSRGIAKRYFPDSDPIGQRIANEDPASGDATWFRIVGVVDDVRHFGLSDPKQPEVFYPYQQWGWSFTDVVLRTHGDPTQTVPEVRQAMSKLDPELPLSNVSTMDERIGDVTARPRFTLVVTGVFALLAVVLAILGIYGLISYTVGQRRDEMGLRMALGARRNDILLRVLKLGLGPTLVGLAAGLLGAFLLRDLLTRVLYQVSASDPVVYVVVAVVALVVAMSAILVPAYRTAQLDPTVALRTE